MRVTFNLIDELDSILRAAAGAVGIDPAAFAPEVRTSDSKFGDFQANGVLATAKRMGVPPRALAEKLAAALPAEVQERFAPSVAGPGFVNFTLTPKVLAEWLGTYSSREAMAAGAAAAHAGQIWIVDYSAPNTAKEMHVGHLRSAVIGEAIARLLAFTGARVIRDNHVGDWGTQFGKLIWACNGRLDEAALALDPIGEFERLYKAGHAAAEADPAIMEAARAELVRLQAGEPASLALWKRINEASLAAFQRIYDRLGIQFDLTLGESFYNDKVGRIYQELAQAGLAVESEGALVVFHPDHPRFKTQPFIIRKSDGAANYASTDLATILYRKEILHAFGVIYVVDSRQRDHFEQLFLTAAEWFKRTKRDLPAVHHVDFGTVLGPNGKPLKTRDGDNIKLKSLLDEAADRAFALVSEKSPESSEEERRAIAEVVGIGSVQYADLSQNRSSDYVFLWDKMLSLEGNTAAYLLYAIARIHSIFRRQDLQAGGPGTEAAASPFETAGEIALARKLVKFPDALRLATESYRPHFLCLYLYELSGEFSAFYNSDKVIVDDPPVRARRLLLCARTLLTLETGMDLLGLRTLKRM